MADKTDKIIFDSERYAKKQSIRRWLIPAAALLAIILIAVAVALVVRARAGKGNVGGADTDFPYSWSADNNGVVTLELDCGAAPGYLWTATSLDPLVSVAESESTDESRMRFILTPQTEGRGVLTFSLLREGDAEDCIYERSILAEVTRSGSSLHSELLSISGKPLLGKVKGGEDTNYPFQLRMDEDGDLLITVTDNAPPQEETEEEAASDEGDKKDEGWSCVSEDDAVAAVIGVITQSSGATAYLRPGTTLGTVRVHMSNATSGAELTLELESDGSGALQLLSHSLNEGNQG